MTAPTDDMIRAARAVLEAAAYEAAAGLIDDPGNNIANHALGQRLCCDGRECGCHGADVGQYLQHFIRALTPRDLARLVREATATSGEKETQE